MGFIHKLKRYHQQIFRSHTLTSHTHHTNSLHKLTKNTLTTHLPQTLTTHTHHTHSPYTFTTHTNHTHSPHTYSHTHRTHTHHTLTPSPHTHSLTTHSPHIIINHHSLTTHSPVTHYSRPQVPQKYQNQLRTKMRLLLLKDDNFYLKGTVFLYSTLQFRFVSYANVPFREIQNIRNFLSHAKTSFAKHESLRNKAHFLKNTKLVSHEILENLVRKKLECQP